jgi:uncharacterized protein YfaS (alpha-2-macroglobulin family)
MMPFFSKFLLVFGLLAIIFPKVARASGQDEEFFKITNDPLWQESDKLAEKQQYAAAIKPLETLKSRLEGSGSPANFTLVLLQITKYKVALHGMETSVKELKAAPWPKDTKSLTLLRMIYAQILVRYYDYYHYEINQRTKIHSDAELDLSQRTSEQIFSEAAENYANIWNNRQELAKYSKDQYGRFISANNFPKAIKTTFFDSYVSLYANLLKDTRGWSPAQANEAFLLNVEDLLKGRAVELDNPKVHPLQKLAFILSQQAAFHEKQGNIGAALQSKFELLEALFAKLTATGARQRILMELDHHLKNSKSDSWYAMGMAVKADLLLTMNKPGSRKVAMEIAESGAAAFPKSPGGARCRDIIRTIARPSLSVNAMAIDGPGQKHGLEIQFHNAKRVHFRSYAFNIKDFVLKSKDWDYYPDSKTVQAMEKGKPINEWMVDLPNTGDYREHKFIADMPAHKKGFYLVIASLDAHFSTENNIKTALFTTVSDLVLSSRQKNSDMVEVEVRAGKTGLAVPEVELSLYRLDYQKGHTKIERAKTNAEGSATFSVGNKSSASYLILAETADDLIITPNPIYLNSGSSTQDPAPSSFLYTDRSIYRPEQKILWKAISYQGKNGDFSVRKSKKIEVSLIDANREKVQTITATTDDFGMAFGEFSVPKGKTLGQWSLSTDNGSSTLSLRVEEYKRPTFEVSFSEAKQPLRLNHMAKVDGTAKYYFGMPLAHGKIGYRIYRSASLPWWSSWCYWDWGNFTKEQLVDSGHTEVDAQGNFSMQFMPKADEDSNGQTTRGGLKNDLSYQYRVEAAITDEGGETRTAIKSFAIGFVSVRLNLHLDQGFVTANSEFKVRVSRTNLLSELRPGVGLWTLYALQEPERTPLPSEVRLPKEFTDFFGGIAVDSDRQNSRINGRYDWKLDVRQWQVKTKISSGTTDIQDAQTSIPFKGLSPGIYRLVIESADDFAVKVDATEHFVVAGPDSQFKLPVFFAVEKSSVPDGQKARIFAMTGFKDQTLLLEAFHDSKLLVKKQVQGGQIIEVDTNGKRGGIGLSLDFLREFEHHNSFQNVVVPWDNKQLTIQWSTFRDKIRPGNDEDWELTISPTQSKGDKAIAATVLAYMYDRSLDFFVPHHPKDPLSVYPNLDGIIYRNTILGMARQVYLGISLRSRSEFVGYQNDRITFEFNYGIGGPGGGGFGNGKVMAMSLGDGPSKRKADMSVTEEEASKSEKPAASAPSELPSGKAKPNDPAENEAAASKSGELRSQFQETAFWLPDVKADKEGRYKVHFTVPDSLTSWNVWALAVTKDLQSGLVHKTTETVKELMVRPYLPRFFREGDVVELKIVLNNTSSTAQEGELTTVFTDPDTGKDVSPIFKVVPTSLTFAVKEKSSATYVVKLQVPNAVGRVVIEIRAKSTSGFSDGERRELPIVPGRMHLSQSRFKILKNTTKQQIKFDDLLQSSQDPSLHQEKMVVTLDAQLFYSVLASLPYLINYPYQSTEQTLNQFVSTAILSSVFTDYPGVAKMAKEFSARKTPVEVWKTNDENRAISIEETPWLQESRGHLPGSDGVDPDLIRVLDPQIAKVNRAESLVKLTKSQTSLGGFPWFPGGPPSPYMTAYVLYGLSKAIEFGADVPKPLVQNAWSYLKRHYIQEIVTHAIARDCCWEEVTFLNYVLANFKDTSWGNDVFTMADRKEMADFSLKHWKGHSPYLKGYLALTLSRMSRPKDAALVWDSVMDSAQISEDEGTHWSAEERSWLWYNDTIESQAFALRTGMELGTKPEALDGMVLWLFLNKKLNHWKSTRATAEVIYSLTHYLKKTKALGTSERASVKMGNVSKTFEFSPDVYSGKNNQIVVDGPDISPKTAGIIEFEKSTPGLMFASATWHFSTTKIPTEAHGDFLKVSRTYFKREVKNGELTLTPINSETDVVHLGDEVEVHLNVETKHEMEYVHLRDPRAAGFEPVNNTSAHKWDLGVYRYEEVRDAGMNFFFEHLPKGKYTLKHRIRATTAGLFTAASATLQPIYAPEFAAYSSGQKLTVADGN